MTTLKESEKSSAAEEKIVTVNQVVVTSDTQEVSRAKYSSSQLSGAPEELESERMESVLTIHSRTSQTSGSSVISQIPSQDEMVRKAERRLRMRRSQMIRFTIGDSDYSLLKGSQNKNVETESNTGEGEDMERLEEMGESKSDMLDDEVIIRDLLTDDDDIDFLINGFDETDVEDIFDDRPPPKSDAIQAKADFLDNFEVPSLSDISEEQSIEEEKQISHVSSAHDSSSIRDPKAGVGKLYNPLTGESITPSPTSSSSSSSSSSSESFEKIADGDYDDVRSLQFNELDVFKTVGQPEDGDEMDMLVRFQQSTVCGPDTHTEADDALHIKYKKDLLQITYGFLNELFRSVVTEAESLRERDAFKMKMNNVKLHKHLSDLRDEFVFEKDLNQYLNSKMCDYYKRNKNFRVLLKQSPVETEKEYKRYYEALTRLDYIVHKAYEAKKMNAYLMSSVLMDLTYIQTISLDTEEHFENFIFKTLCSNKSENLRKFVDRELRLMAMKRCEISDTRLFLITRKHTLGRISDRIRKLEKIDDDISMDDFIAIQNQVVALDKKIEERNIELAKLRYNYHMELHLTQHNREKAYSLHSKILERQNNLEKVQATQHELRERLYKAKLDRGRMRKQYVDLSFQGGLLSMPGLMYDYDETVQKVDKKHADLLELKDTFKRLNQRIADLESRCS